MAPYAQKKEIYEISDQQLYVESEIEKLKIRDVWIKLWIGLSPVHMLVQKLWWLFFEAQLVRQIGPNIPSEEISSRDEWVRYDQFGGKQW